jgi:hypothetical protein
MHPPNLYARVHLFSMRKQRTGPRVRHAPGLPCALIVERARRNAKLGQIVSREGEGMRAAMSAHADGYRFTPANPGKRKTAEPCPAVLKPINAV